MASRVSRKFRRITRNDPIDFTLILLALVATLTLYSGQTIPGSILWGVAYASLLAAAVFRLRHKWQGTINSLSTALLVLTLASAGPVGVGDVASVEDAWISVGLVALAIGALRMVETIAGYVGVQVANVRGVRVMPRIKFLRRALQTCVVASPLALFILGHIDAPGIYWLAVALLLWLAVGAIYFIAAVRRTASRAARRALPVALAALNPAFAVYWDAPKNTGYQLQMWVPYLKRLGFPFFVMIRNRTSWAEARKVCGRDVPLVLAPTMAEVDDYTVPSLRVAFYVNNAARNVHFVRFDAITHVQLLHGESDKAPSYNPVTGMFDKIYVAGQAGIDRYANHGVLIDKRKFRIVGRPQVAEIRQAEEHDDNKRRTVLYAPTWVGLHADSSYSSLPNGVAIVSELLDRDCRVIFRPHPWSYKSTEFRALCERIQAILATDRTDNRREHIFGQVAEKEMSVNECFNESDAMISDVSSVVGDYLYSLKPFATTAFERDEATFIDEFPLAAAGYLISGERETWGEVFENLLDTDPLRSQREQMRSYYLGDFPTDSYEFGFIETARREIESSMPGGTTSVIEDGADELTTKSINH